MYILKLILFKKKSIKKFDLSFNCVMSGPFKNKYQSVKCKIEHKQINVETEGKGNFLRNFYLKLYIFNNLI